jgi:tetratricopeptide (TPR) repeat protein
MAKEASNNQTDVRLEEGKKLMKKGEYEEAIGLFSSFLQSRVEEFGELAVESAQAYYEYGNALLVQQEENPSDTLIGNADDKNDSANGASTIPDTVVGSDDENEEDGNEEDGNEKDDDDLQIAWENLDVARLILEKSSEGYEQLLSSVYIRLGDLMRLEERPADAVTEYMKALSLREKICSSNDRDLCDVYFCLAVAYVDLSSKVEEMEVKDRKKDALEFYRKARMVLQNQSEICAESEDVQDLIDILTETIDALTMELTTSSSSDNVGSSGSGPITTIGFGAPYESAVATINNIPVGNKRTADQMATDVNVMQIKKKPKGG